MPESDLTHSDLSVALQRQDEANRYLVGVIINGNFVPFGALSIPSYDEAVSQAPDSQPAQAGSEPAQADATPQQPPAQ